MMKNETNAAMALQDFSPASAVIVAKPRKGESQEERADRLYQHPGGPLMALMLEQCRLRCHTRQQMAEACGVTLGYVNQLQNGIRQQKNVSQEVAQGFAAYLGIPTIIVKLLSGGIPLSDFSHNNETEEQVLDRALRQIQGDPMMQTVLPPNPQLLPVESKKSLVLMYVQFSSIDVLQTRELPNIVYWLRQSAVRFDEAMYVAQAERREAEAP